MATTSYNADSINELYSALESMNAFDKKAIFFGQVPGLAYIFDLEPAINTVWPDLDSYSTSKFSDELSKISAKGIDAPIIIMGQNLPEYANIEAKKDVLMDYIASNDYNKVFESDRFTVYTAVN